MDLSNKKFIISYDNKLLKFKINCINPIELKDIIDYFSDNNPAAFFVKQYGYRIPDKISVINSFGYFSIGLIYEVLKYIKVLYHNLNDVYITDEASEIIKTKVAPLKDFVKDNQLDNFTVSNISKTISLRDYQEAIIKNLIYSGYGCGLFESPTSSGKSFILSNFIWTVYNQINDKIKFLILVPNRQLVDQFYKDMLDYGFNKKFICKLAGGTKTSDNDLKKSTVIISNRQYLFSNSDRLPKINCLICDEAHQISPDSSTIDLIEKINADMRIGCSGTLPKEKYKLLTLKGIFGKIVQSENILNLQSKGFITKLKINRISVFDSVIDKDTNCLFSLKSTHHYDPSNELISFNAAWDSETKYITENFNKLYIPVLNEVKKLPGNILILFDRKDFGKGLYELTNQTLEDIPDEPYHTDTYCDVKTITYNQQTHRNAWYIDGEIPVEKREDIRATLEKTNNNLLFAQSATFSTGINIKNLPNIAFFFSGKSHSKVVQSIGRSLRLHANKDYANLVDVVFNYKYSTRHCKERDLIYKSVYAKTNPDNIITITI